MKKNLQKTVSIALLVLLCMSSLIAQNQKSRAIPEVQAEGITNSHAVQTAPPTRAGTPIFSEGFEDGTFPPTGWTRYGTNFTGFPTGGHDAPASFGYNTSTSSYATYGITTPAITVGAHSVLSFWTKFKAYTGTSAYYTSYRIKVSTTTNAQSAFTTIKEYSNYAYTGINSNNVIYNVGANVWYEMQANLFTYAGQQIYLAIEVYDHYGNDSIRVDDVLVFELPENELRVTAGYYAQIPTSQTLPPLTAKATNTGYVTQTNLTLSTTLNGNPLGTSAPIASLAYNATSANLTVTPASAVPVTPGNQTLIYTITSSEGAEGSTTLTFEGTPNIFALDNAIATSGGLGNSSAISLGNIFEVTSPTMLSEVMVGFSSVASTQTYTISLYRMTADLTCATPAMFTTAAIARTTGFSTQSVPETILPAGRYFLCVNQTSSTNIGLLQDGNTAKSCCTLNTSTGALSRQSSFGAVAVRMIVRNLPGNDAAITAITAPVSGGDLSATAPVTATIKNWGVNAITTVDLELIVDGRTPIIETYTGNIALGATANYTFTATADVSANGPHTITVRAILAGDENHANDTLRKTITNTVCNFATFPWTEGFEDYTGSTYSTAGVIPICWYTQAQSGSAAYTPHITGSGTYHYPHSGTKALIFTAGSSQGGTNTYAVLPKFNKPINQLSLSFWYRMESATAANGTMTVGYITGNQNNVSSYQVLFTLSNTTTVTQTPVYRLSAASETATYIVIRWAHTGSSYYSAGIDDIIVDEVFDNDAAITAITAPVNGLNLSATQPVTATIKNLGLNAITTVDLELTVDGGTPIIETYTGNLAFGATANYTFTATADVSAGGNHIITVRAILAGDERHANDTLRKTITNTICNVTTFPWTEDFEDYAGTTYSTAGVIPVCWYTQAQSGSEAYTPHITGSGSYHYPHSGTKALTFTGGNNQGGANTYAVLPKFNTPINRLSLSFWYRMESATATNGTMTVGYITGAYDNTGSYVPLFTLTNTPNTTTSLQTPTYLFSAAPETATYIVIRWAYTGTSFYSAGIDDIIVDKVFDNDATVTAITSPTATTNASYQVKANIKNNGLNPITSMNVAYKLNNGTPVVESFTGNLATDASTEFIFTTPATLTAGFHTLEVYTDLTGDENPANDAKTIDLMYNSPLTLYGYRIYDDDNALPIAVVSFSTGEPATVTMVNGYTDGSYSISGGAFYADDLYMYSITNNTAATPKNFIQLSTDSWTATTTEITAIAIDMTYDYTTNTMFAYSGQNLLTVDLQTGLLTTVGYMGRSIFTLACNLSGVLYAVDNTGKLCTIDKTIGTVTEIGATGITPKYIQSMAFDHHSGRLLWAMCNPDDDGLLIELNPATGKAYNWGILGGNAEVVALYTPYTHIVVSEDAAITAITAPTSGRNLTTAETVTAIIKNNGTSPITTLGMELTVNSGTPITETYTGNIAPGATVNYTFTATVDLSAAGEYTITVRAILENDANPANDAKTVTITNTVCEAITAFPFTENFDSESWNCWTMISNNTANGWVNGDVLDMDDYYEGDGTMGLYADAYYPENGTFFGFSSYNHATDYTQYLISPELPNNNGLTVTFDYLAYYRDEIFSVGYSLTGNNPADFTWSSYESIVTDSYNYNWYDVTDFEQFTGTFPAGTKYIAIRYESEYEYHLYIDNIVIDGQIVIALVSKTPEGNNVDLDAEVKVTFSGNVTPADALTGITINGVAATASIQGAVLTIAHDDFDYNTEYTVNIPAGTLNEYTAEIEWTFTTKEGEGISTIGKNEVLVYPNPTSGTVTIRTSEPASEIKIFDMIGRIQSHSVTRHETGEAVIDVSHLPSGIYLLKVDTNGKTSTHKLVISK